GRAAAARAAAGRAGAPDDRQSVPRGREDRRAVLHPPADGRPHPSPRRDGRPLVTPAPAAPVSWSCDEFEIVTICDITARAVISHMSRFPKVGGPQVSVPLRSPRPL